MKNILVVDDNLMVQEIIAEHLSDNFKVTVLLAISNEEALIQIASQEISLIICDYEMPSGKGTELLEHMRANHIAIPFILFSGNFDLEISLINPLIEVINNKSYQNLFNHIELLNIFTKK